MSVGTAFHARTLPYNRKMQWREWSGYFAASVYADFHDIEYNAIREQAALIDVSPLYKYEVHGRDAEQLVDRVITRDATKLKVGQVFYSPWCDEDGKVVDDGTIHRLGPNRFRWTAADPQYRWLSLNAAGLDVTIEDTTETTAALALQGPLEPGGPRGGRRRRARRPALLPAARRDDRRHPDRHQPDGLHRRPGLRAVGRCRPGRRRCGTPSSRPASRSGSGRPG